MSHPSYGFLYNSRPANRPPPRLSSQLPPMLLSKSHLTARGHSLGLPRMWQHHAISKVPHLTAPPQACGAKLQTRTTATAKTVHTEFISSHLWTLSSSIFRQYICKQHRCISFSPLVLTTSFSGLLQSIPKLKSFP